MKKLTALLLAVLLTVSCVCALASCQNTEAKGGVKVIDIGLTEEEYAFAVQKGNTVLKEAIDSVLSTMTVEDFNAMMAEAIDIQPLSE